MGGLKTTLGEHIGVSEGPYLFTMIATSMGLDDVAQSGSSSNVASRKRASPRCPWAYVRLIDRRVVERQTIACDGTAGTRCETRSGLMDIPISR